MAASQSLPSPAAGLPGILVVDDDALVLNLLHTLLQQQLRQQATRPFDLHVGPLLRVCLFQLTTQESVLLLVLHHIISDGWSLNVLLAELSQLYAAFEQQQPSPLPELPVQYADFALWQRQWLQGEVLDELLAYWKEQLAGAPALLLLPTDHPRPSVQTFRGASQAWCLSAELTT